MIEYKLIESDTEGHSTPARLENVFCIYMESEDILFSFRIGS